MAVYTHFGSMEELRKEVRREGFERLRSRLEAVRTTSDPMADLTLLGSAYYLTATASPNLYRAMFLDGPVDEEDLATGLDTFMFLVEGISRCMREGRLPRARNADPADLAVLVWAMSHGIVSLQLANLLPEEEAVDRLRAGAGSLFLAWGEAPKKLEASLAKAQKRSSELDGH